MRRGRVLAWPLKFFRIAVTEVEPGSVRHRAALAEAYFRAGRYDDCRRIILALHAEGVRGPLSETALAAMAAREGRLDEAREHLRRAEAIGGASAGVLEMMARLYLRVRCLADAARLFDSAIALEPGRATAHDGRAIAFLLAGEALAAERHAREAIRLNPDYYDARYHLGLALARQQRSDEAIDVLKDAVALSGGGPSAHRRIADLLQGRGDSAFAMHHRALAGRPDRITRRPWLDAGWSCEEWGVNDAPR
jgi:tetratricopeptide (TPR) repeat protein